MAASTTWQSSATYADAVCCHDGGKSCLALQQLNLLESANHEKQHHYEDAQLRRHLKLSFIKAATVKAARPPALLMTEGAQGLQILPPLLGATAT
jgi:hypothetical protein